VRGSRGKERKKRERKKGRKKRKGGGRHFPPLRINHPLLQQLPLPASHFVCDGVALGSETSKKNGKNGSKSRKRKWEGKRKKEEKEKKKHSSIVHPCPATHPQSNESPCTTRKDERGEEKEKKKRGPLLTPGVTPPLIDRLGYCLRTRIHGREAEEERRRKRRGGEFACTVSLRRSMAPLSVAVLRREEASKMSAGEASRRNKGRSSRKRRK